MQCFVFFLKKSLSVVAEEKNSTWKFTLGEIENVYIAEI